MDALVVYDSQYGNTQRVARAIGSRLEKFGSVRLVSVEESPGIDLTGVDLLVIGGPTQAHNARRMLRDWIEAAPPAALHDLAAATFDTRLHWPVFLSGSAARSVAKILRRSGCRLIAPPESFFVAGREGPLLEGEIASAEAWADALGLKLAAKAAPSDGSRHAS